VPVGEGIFDWNDYVCKADKFALNKYIALEHLSADQVPAASNFMHEVIRQLQDEKRI